MDALPPPHETAAERRSPWPMRCSPTIDHLTLSLAKAQGQFPAIEKDKTARIQTKSGAAYTYTYADLATILGAVRPSLSANELAILQPVAVNGNRVTVTSVLAHSSGQWVASELGLPIADPGDARSLASAITYGRRYGLIALLGIAPADEDDDAAAAVTRPSGSLKKAPPPPPSPPDAATTPPAPAAPPTLPPPSPADEYITDAQRRRLFAIGREGGWSDQDVKAWLITEGIGSTSKIKRDEYAAVVQRLQQIAP